MNLTLYSITAFIILDTDGNRVLSKYYRQETTAASPSAMKGLASTKDQRAFEKGLWQKNETVRRSLLRSLAMKSRTSLFSV